MVFLAIKILWLCDSKSRQEQTVWQSIPSSVKITTFSQIHLVILTYMPLYATGGVDLIFRGYYRGFIIKHATIVFLQSL